MKRLFLTVVLSAALIGPCLAAGGTDEPLGPDQWPQTVQATVSDLLSRLSEADKTSLRQMKESDLALLHFGWGMGIRNHYGLWRGNRALIKDACGEGCHPDDASGVIIKAVWQALQGNSPGAA